MKILQLDLALVLAIYAGTTTDDSSKVPTVERWVSTPMWLASVCCTFTNHCTSEQGAHAWPMLWEVRITTHSKGQEEHSQDSCRNKQALTTVCLQQQHVCVARILS